MKFLPTLALGTMLLSSVNCASNLEGIVNKQETITQKETLPLYVNSGKEHYVIEKSREEGENDILGLTLTDEQEEAWVFVEYLNGMGAWYENGIEIECETDRLYLDERPLIEIIKNKENIKQLSLYHFHPVDMVRNYDHSQTPSLYDSRGFLRILIKIINTADELNKHDKKLADKIDFKIAVSTGIYTVKFDDGVFLNGEKWNELTGTIYDIFIARMLSVVGEHKEFDYSQSNRENFAEVNKRFAEKFDSELMQFSFEPRKVY